MDYRAMLKDGYRQSSYSEPLTQLEYLGEYIFDFTTYEGEYSQLFAKKALEVCKAISDRQTFEYIVQPENRLWYLLMVNMPFFADRIEWGTSIRGAWWRHQIELDSCGLWIGDNQIAGTLNFDQGEWHKFIDAVIEFAATPQE